MTSLKEEIALVLAKYTTKIIKEGDVDPTVHYQILELIEKRIDEAFPGDSLCIDREKLKELLK